MYTLLNFAFIAKLKRKTANGFENGFETEERGCELESASIHIL